MEELFGEIIIAEAVYNELKAKKSYGYKEVEADYIKVKAIKGKKYRDLLLSQMDLGEAEIIVLATELNADIVIIGDNIGYKIAKNSGLFVI